MKIKGKKKHFLHISFFWPTLWVAMVVLTDTGLCGEEQLMEGKKSFWNLVEKVENARPYTPKAVESLLGVTLELESEHEYTLFYKMKELQSSATTKILRAVDLRVSKTKPGDQNFLVIELADCGMTFEDIQKRYPEALFEPALPGPPPQGFALDSVDYLSVERPWGKISFGFLLKNPKLLSEVIFSPKAP
jgi:hypothetical protein